MFAPLLDAIERAGAPLRTHAPTVLDYLRRYVEAKELEAEAAKTLAYHVGSVTHIIRANIILQNERNNDGE